MTSPHNKGFPWRLVLGLAAGLLLGGGIVLGLWAIDTRQRHAPTPPSVEVPESWQALRGGHMHRVHLAQAQGNDQDIACNECHGEDFTEPLTATVCHDCHGAETRLVHTLDLGPDWDKAALTAAKAPTDCLTCHGIDAAPESQAAECTECHNDSQPTPLNSHQTVDCVTCHLPHGAEPLRRLAPEDCRSCHEDAHIDAAHGDCTGCHRPHQPASAAEDTCTGCHHGNWSSARTLREHERCTTCHEPHGFSGDSARACADCHGTKAHGLVSPSSPTCQSCHAPHRARPSGQSSCNRCHTLDTDHPATKGHTRCTTCHAAHSAPHGARQACAECHQQAATPPAHGDKATCEQCHGPHHFSEGLTQSCAQCHTGKTTALAARGGHERCAQCHRDHPHRLAGPLANPPVACQSCHSKTQTLPHHDRCISCHRPHEQPGATSAQACQRCHASDAHGGASDPHSDLKAGCIACHAPHPKADNPAQQQPPSCDTCHSRTPPGLHRLPEHGRCNDCHRSPHDRKQWASRATCTACHSDRQAHEPKAETCQGCHIFRN